MGEAHYYQVSGMNIWNEDTINATVGDILFIETLTEWKRLLQQWSYTYGIWDGEAEYTQLPDGLTFMNALNRNPYSVYSIGLYGNYGVCNKPGSYTLRKACLNPTKTIASTTYSIDVGNLLHLNISATYKIKLIYGSIDPSIPISHMPETQIFTQTAVGGDTINIECKVTDDIPVAEGYTFKGWNAWSRGYTTVDFRPGDTLTLTAAWDSSLGWACTPVWEKSTATTNLSVKHSGSWKKPSKIYAKQSGSWKEVKSVYVKNSGAWKKV